MADRIVREITDAIVDQRLAPGTKLAEEALADLFSVSRTTVRAALQRLSAEGLVIIKPNRGAFVFKPTIEESRHVFEARRILEDALLRFAFEAFTAKERNRLQKCLEQEKNARETKRQRQEHQAFREIFTHRKKTLRDVSAIDHDAGI